MSYRTCPRPGPRSRDWLQNARENFTVAVNPMPDANLIPGRRPPAVEDRFTVRKRMLGMENELAKKWKD
jgi:hypothetical protein